MKKKVFFFVFFAHIVGVFWLTRESNNNVISKKSIKVKTICLKATKPRPNPLQKQITLKPQFSTKNSIKNTTKTNKSLEKVNKTDPFLKNLQDKLAKLKSIQKNFEKDDLYIPSSVSFDISGIHNEDSYKDLLATFFKEKLKLPDKGKVKAFLKISNSGTLLECKILSAESSENEYYLKNQLHNLKLPCFNGDEKSYVICFSDV